MPALDNPRHERFSVLVAKGAGSDGACYVEAGYKAKDADAARACASRLLASGNVAARVAELKAEFKESTRIGFAITTTDVARHLWNLSNYDIRDVLTLETTGRGRARRQRVVIKDTKDWPEAMARTCQGVKVNADGSIVLLMPIRSAPGIKVGEHLGMFQGESQTQIGDRVTNNIVNNNTVYVDAPRETADEWAARIERQRGIKQIAPPKAAP